MDKAIVLAAGRGSRMQRRHESAAHSAAQAEVASAGLKAMMPVGRPFVDYVLGGLRDAGYRHVCLVVGSEHDRLRKHCERLASERLSIEFVVQAAPLGTAHALRSAKAFAADDPFLLINSDNFYPNSALAGLRQLSGSAVAAFTPAGLCRGNVVKERLRAFAAIQKSSAGLLERVIEKPSEAIWTGTIHPRWINMNCWRFRPVIFDACAAVTKSPRGEYELTDAVNDAIERLGEPFQILEVNEPVLDLSSRADVAEVTRRLSCVAVHL